MPSLDYRHAVQVLGQRAGAGVGRFYDGSPGRELARCPACLREMDPQFPHDAATPGCAELAAETRELRSWLAKHSKKERQWRRK
jgi:hypothetical protein